MSHYTSPGWRVMEWLLSRFSEWTAHLIMLVGLVLLLMAVSAGITALAAWVTP